MLKRSAKSSAFHSSSVLILLLLFAIVANGCDRGASEEIQAAERFADALSRNNVATRDSMIVTYTFKKYFDNAYVANDYIMWMQTIYDIRARKFISTSRADVDRDLKAELTGALNTSDEIEETGMVRVKSPIPDQPAAYFWMVKQKGKHWAVAMVTKGEMAVNFK